MARATVQPPAVPMVTLHLDAEEALYLYSALRQSTPARDQFGDCGEDPIYEALGEALKIAGLTTVGNDARPH